MGVPTTSSAQESRTLPESWSATPAPSFQESRVDRLRGTNSSAPLQVVVRTCRCGSRPFNEQRRSRLVPTTLARLIPSGGLTILGGSRAGRVAELFRDREPAPHGECQAHRHLTWRTYLCVGTRGSGVTAWSAWSDCASSSLRNPAATSWSSSFLLSSRSSAT